MNTWIFSVLPFFNVYCDMDALSGIKRGTSLCSHLGWYYKNKQKKKKMVHSVNLFCILWRAGKPTSCRCTNRVKPPTQKKKKKKKESSSFFFCKYTRHWDEIRFECVCFLLLFHISAQGAVEKRKIFCCCKTKKTTGPAAAKAMICDFLFWLAAFHHPRVVVP